MLLVYFGLWILFNGRADADVLITGAGAALLIYLFTWKIVGLTPARELRGWKRTGKYLRFFGYLFVEILKANRQVARLVLDPKCEMEPQLITLRTKCREEMSRVLLSNAITLTPGTITVGQDEDKLVVHALDKETAQGLEDNGFERRLAEMEGGKE
ncbi:MAG: Na+/H+ antiporter subunit E [Eubacteriales bacterium]|nr:Na+/H+ antiporter subunit E [Eubacteriales bacterium]